MIDPILTLAHSVQSNKGVFALLLGSGVSRAAGIPTGWDVTLDLVRRVAAMEGADQPVEPEVWFKEKHGKSPEYSDLLDLLARTGSERRSILHPLFEPTAEERATGLKVPTRAHKAISRLVEGGYIKVIITTNFDRLLETALEEQGIIPTVLSTVDSINGAKPLMHQRCVILKLHGDYLDDRIKNTQYELSIYDPVLEKYLDRIFDEFGLIISGWSGEWDPALRSAVERCGNRRYTTFWTVRDAPSVRAAKLIAHREAQVLRISSAEDFFESLAEKIKSLEELSVQPLNSVGVAIATVKRYACDPVYRIKLNDLLVGEANRANELIVALPTGDGSFPIDEKKRLLSYESATRILREMLFHASFWAELHHHDSIKRAIACLVPRKYGIDRAVWLDAIAYPASLAFNAAAFGALMGKKYALLGSLCQMSFGKEFQVENALPDLSSLRALPENLANHLDERYLALSQYFSTQLFSEESEGRSRYSSTLFDRLEVFLTLIYLDRHRNDTNPPCSISAPYGRYVLARDHAAYQYVFEEADREGDLWEPLVAGLFGGRIEQFIEIKNQFYKILNSAPRRYY